MITTTGPFNPSAAVDQGSSWTSPTNVFVSDAVYASGNISGGGSITSNLNITGFGFAIPSVATIKGILVESQRYGSNAGDASVMLLKAGTAVGTNKGNFTNTWPTSAGGYFSYGGSADLWGTTLTPADVNASNFGVQIAAYNTHGGGTAFVDNVRITVFWDIGALATNANLPKRYLYKVYSNGQYLGNLPAVVSDFGFSQEINTIGSQINVQCAISADTSALQSVSNILDETGANVLDETGANITSENSPPQVGLGTTSNTLIKNGNQVIVWEFGYYHPNGLIVFRGEINRWEANYGGDGGNDSINILIYADGQDLDNHLVRGSPFAYTLDQSQTSNNVSSLLFYTDPSYGGSWTFFGQSLTVGAGVTNIGAISLLLSGTANVTVKLYSSTAMTTLIASINQYVNVGSASEIQFSFPTHATVTPAQVVFFTVTVDQTNSITIYSQNTNPYAGGAMYTSVFAGGSGGSWTTVSGSDLYFKTFSSNGSTVATYTSQDPTSGMLIPILNDYIAEGGIINYTAASIQSTALSLTYKFNTSTVYEAAQAIQTIAPDGYYFYVDPGTDTFYMKQASTTADMVLTKGRHLSQITIVATIEYIVNASYVTGADISGANIYTLDQDVTSINLYGVRLNRKNDAHIQDTTTAHAVGSSFVVDHKDEEYQTTVTIVDKTIDITLFKIGMIIGFNGFGTFVDGLLSQITRIDYKPESVILTLGIRPKKVPTSLDQVTRNLIALNTVGNPTAPS